MSLVRLPFVMLALLAQILAGIVPCAMMLCVHDDGRTVLELSTDLCCRETEACEDACSSGCDDATSGPSVRAVADDCRDHDLSMDQVLTDGPGEPGSPARQLIPPSEHDGGASRVLVRVELPMDRGPPPPPLLVHLSTVRLCC